MKLSDLTTFKIGGEAKYFFDVKNLIDLKKAVEVAKKNNLPVMVIGSGSNVLVSDEIIEKVVIRLSSDEIHKKDKGNYVEVKVDSGVNWDRLVEWSVDKGYQGIECLSFIPGLVGAAPIQNIGAYGQELSDTFTRLEAYDTFSESLTTFDKKDVDFGYRDSVFKRPENEGRYVVVNVTLRLNKSKPPSIKYKELEVYLENKGVENPTLIDVRQAVIDIRKSKLEDPAIMPNAGSFFKNPIVNINILDELRTEYPEIPSFNFGDKFKIPAAWLIEQSGWKGKRHKDVGVSKKHALVLVNYGGGSANQVKELASKVKSAVFDKFGIVLEQEVRDF